MIRTIIVEDSRIIRDYLEAVLEEDDRFVVEGSFSDAFEAESYCRSHSVDLVLMDVLTDHHHSGLAAGGRIRKEHPQTKVVIVTSLIDPEILEKAKAGAADSLWYKEHGKETLIEVLMRTMDGEQIMPESAPSVELNEMFSGEITPRQMEILRCFVKGMTYSEIAEQTGLSARGVRWNVNEIVDRAGFSNKHELLAALLNNKIIITTLVDEEE